MKKLINTLVLALLVTYFQINAMSDDKNSTVTRITSISPCQNFIVKNSSEHDSIEVINISQAREVASIPHNYLQETLAFHGKISLINCFPYHRDPDHFLIVAANCPPDSSAKRNTRVIIFKFSTLSNELLLIKIVNLIPALAEIKNFHVSQIGIGCLSLEIEFKCSPAQITYKYIVNLG